MSSFVKCFETCYWGTPNNHQGSLQPPLLTWTFVGKGVPLEKGLGGARCSWRAVGPVARVALQTGTLGANP